MKKTRILAAFTLIVALLSAAAASAVDFGGALASNTKLEESALLQQGRLTLWLGADLGKSTEFYLQGLVKVSTEDPIFLADLERLSLKGRYPAASGAGATVLELALGRDRFADFTGLLLDHALDGIKLGFGYRNVLAEMFFAYGGLVLKPSSLLQLSIEDYRDKTLADVYLGPQRIIGGFRLSIPELFARQGLDLAALFQEDLRPLLQDDLPEEGDTVQMPGRGGALDSQYFGLGFHGSILANLFYNGFFYLGTGRTLSYLDSGAGYVYQYSAILSYLGGLGVRCYLESLLFSKIDLQAVIASGDADFSSFVEGNTVGMATAFVPISLAADRTVFSPQLSNLVRGRLSYSLKPFSGLRLSALEQLAVEAAAAAYFRPTSGPISESGLIPNAAGYYLGTGAELGLSYRPFSDLLFTASGSVFFPNSSIFIVGMNVARYKAALEASLEF